QDEWVRHFSVPAISGSIDVMDPRMREIVTAANIPTRPVRVIPLMHSCRLQEPAEMTLLSLEQWTTFFALRWFFATTKPADDIDLRLQAGLRWEGDDDRGNHYIGADYGGGG